MAARLWPESVAICHRHAFMGWGRAVLPLPAAPRLLPASAASLVAAGGSLPTAPEQTAAAKCIEVHKQI